MEDKDILKILQSIGMKTFIQYYEQLKTKSITPERMMELENYSLGSARTKVSRSNSIFDKDLQVRALQIVIQSGRIDIPLKEKAEELLSQEID